MPDRNMLSRMKQSDISMASAKTSTAKIVTIKKLPVDKRKTMIKVMDPSVH